MLFKIIDFLFWDYLSYLESDGMQLFKVKVYHLIQTYCTLFLNKLYVLYQKSKYYIYINMRSVIILNSFVIFTYRFKSNKMILTNT